MKLSTCHPNRKAQARGLCKNCYDKWLKEANPTYKKSQISNATAWAKANPEKYKIQQERRRLKQLNDPFYKLKRRNIALKKKYGITVEDYDLLLKKQNGVCAICSREPGKRPLHVDHSHSTGKVRGLLCHQCNWYLGTIDADPAILDKITYYLLVK